MDTWNLGLWATVLILALGSWWLLRGPPAGARNAIPEGPEIKVTRIYVHPIKSCKPLSVKSWEYQKTGLKYDRHWAIVDDGSSHVLTARETPTLVLVEPTIDLAAGSLTVKFPASSGLPSFAVALDPSQAERKGYQQIDQTHMFAQPLFAVLKPTCIATASTPIPAHSPSDLFSAYLGKSVSFVIQGFETRPLQKFEPARGDLDYDGVGETSFADGYPFLLTSEESYEEVKGRVEATLAGYTSGTSTPAEQAVPAPPWGKIGKLDPTRWEGKTLTLERFRPNIVVQGAVTPFAEEMWGKVDFVAANGERKGGMIVVSRCGRCQLPNVDPETGIPDPALPYKVIAKYRRVDPELKHTPCFGVNTVPMRTSGVISVGDTMRVLAFNKWESLDGQGKPVKR